MVRRGVRAPATLVHGKQGATPSSSVWGHVAFAAASTFSLAVLLLLTEGGEGGGGAPSVVVFAAGQSTFVDMRWWSREPSSSSEASASEPSAGDKEASLADCLRRVPWWEWGTACDGGWTRRQGERRDATLAEATGLALEPLADSDGDDVAPTADCGDTVPKWAHDATPPPA